RHTRFSRDWSSDVCSSDLEDRPSGSAMMKTSVVRRRIARWAVLALLLVAAGVFTLPFLWSLSISFQPPGDVFRWPIKLVPEPFKIGRASCREIEYFFVANA